MLFDPDYCAFQGDLHWVQNEGRIHYGRTRRQYWTPQFPACSRSFGRLVVTTRTEWIYRHMISVCYVQAIRRHDGGGSGLSEGVTHPCRRDC